MPAEDLFLFGWVVIAILTALCVYGGRLLSRLLIPSARGSKRPAGICQGFVRPERQPDVATLQPPVLVSQAPEQTVSYDFQNDTQQQGIRQEWNAVRDWKVLQATAVDAALSKKCVEALAAVAKSSAPALITSGDRIEIGRTKIHLMAKIEQELDKPSRVVIGLVVDVFVNYVWQPLTGGSADAGGNRDEAVQAAVRGWAMYVGPALLGALGVKIGDEPQKIGSFLVYKGMTGIAAPFRVYWPEEQNRQLLERLDPFIRGMEHSSGLLHSISLVVDVHDGTTKSGQCHVDNHISPELLKALESFSWWNQNGNCLFKQFYVLRRKSTGSVNHSTAARNVADVGDFIVGLDINSEPSLTIRLDARGAIHRCGDGAMKNRSKDYFIGVTDPAIFERVRSHLTEATLQRLGQGFQRQNVRGAPCKLTLIIGFNDGTSRCYEYLYGSESEGPPSDVVDFVRAARRETEGWYERQLRMVQAAADEHRH